MTDLDQTSERHPLLSVLLTLLVMAIGFVVIGPMIGLLLALPFYDGPMTGLIDQINSPVGHPELKIPLFILQGAATFFGLIVGPAVYLLSEGKSPAAHFRGKNISVVSIGLAFLITLVFMGVNSIFIEWNSGITFPAGFEDWARSYEDRNAELTRFLTEFDSTAQLIVAIVVIAVFPAIGEEFVFRGILQKRFTSLTGNIHVAIWISAALFSAIHLQFYGFVPRMLLGALFGYLYFWSGNLWTAIAAHFMNNAASVLALYAYQQGKFEYDIDKPEAMPVYAIAVSFVLTAALMYYFYRHHQQINPTPSQRDRGNSEI